jgi:RNA polymerase sigma factor (sigma-70 family)
MRSVPGWLGLGPIPKISNEIWTTLAHELTDFAVPVSYHLMPPPDSELGLWFASHVQPHEGMLRAWLRGRFRQEGDVDDIIQEAYVRLLKAREREKVVSPKAFLFAVARNLALDRQRHRIVAEAESLAENEALAVFDEGLDVRETVAHNQELEILTEAIQSLPDRCRQIFTLRKVYGLSQVEIAERLRISENTVSAQLTIGVKKCMELMLRTRREREGRWP